MALHNTDKTSLDRSNPAPATHDVAYTSIAPIVNIPRPSHSTVSTQYTTANPTGVGRVQMQNQSIVANDGSTNRALFGFNQNTSTWGFFAVTSGNDVLTATKYALSSDYDQFKIVATGTTSINANLSAGSTGSSTIVHGLGFIPSSLIFVDLGGAVYQQLPLTTGLTIASGLVGFNNWVYAATDATSLTINFYSPTTTNWGTFSFRYYLLAETAN